MLSWFGQPLILAWFAVVAFGFLTGPALILTATLWSVFVFCALLNWAYCQSVDPAKSATHPMEKMIFDTLVPWLSKTNHDTHYCSVCRKSVPGIDHHCKWLSTCVGSRTYQSFYLLTVFASLTYLWQLIALCLLISPVWNTDEVKRRSNDVFHDGASQIGFYVVCAIGIASTLPVAAFYTLLFLFHSYLQWRGLTTYGWFIQRSEYLRKRKAAKRLQLQSEKKHAAGVPNTTTAAALTKAMFGSPTTSPIGSQVGSQTSQNDLLVPPAASSSPPFVSVAENKQNSSSSRGRRALGDENGGSSSNNNNNTTTINGHLDSSREDENSERDEEGGGGRLGSGSLPGSPLLLASSGVKSAIVGDEEGDDDVEMQLNVS